MPGQNLVLAALNLWASLPSDCYFSGCVDVSVDNGNLKMELVLTCLCYDVVSVNAFFNMEDSFEEEVH